jgi:hypothetical protein
MNQSRLGIALLIIFQIAILLTSNNNHILALQSHNQKRISFQTIITPPPPQTNNTSSTIKKFALIADENILKVSPDNALGNQNTWFTVEIDSFMFIFSLFSAFCRSFCCPN